MTSTSIIDSFLTCIRNRLWLQATLDCLRYGVWWASAIAVFSGFLHIFFYPLTWTLYLTLLLTPLLVTLFLGLVFHRPSLASAAASADHWFNGKSLMSTALDQLNAPTKIRTRTRQFVIDQATNTAATWQKRLASQHKLVIPRQILIPLSLTLIGFFLLTLPQQANRSSGHEQLSTNNHIKPVSQNSVSTDLVADMQQVLRTLATEKKPHETNNQASQNMTPIPSSLNNRDSLNQARDPLADNKTPIFSVAKLDKNPLGADDSKDLEVPHSDKTLHPTRPGEKRSNAPGTSADTRTYTQAAAQTAKLDIEFFNIVIPQAADGAAATGKGKNRDLNALETKTTRRRVARSVAAAERGISMPYEMTLSPAQKRYLARYFRRLGETP